MPPKRAIQVRFLSAGPKNCYIYILDIGTLKQNYHFYFFIYSIDILFYLQVAYLQMDYYLFKTRGTIPKKLFIHL